jgi:hypothetical protein
VSEAGYAFRGIPMKNDKLFTDKVRELGKTSFSSKEE